VDVNKLQKAKAESSTQLSPQNKLLDKKSWPNDGRIFLFGWTIQL